MKYRPKQDTVVQAEDPEDPEQPHFVIDAKPFIPPSTETVTLGSTEVKGGMFGSLQGLKVKDPELLSKPEYQKIANLGIA